MRSRQIASALVLALTTAACQQQPSPTPDSPDQELIDLRAQVAELDNKVQALEDSRDLAKLMYDLEHIAYLTPGDEGYSVVRYDLGYLTVKIEDVKPFASSSKIVLNLGNVQSASINGLKGTIEWGPMDKKGLPDNSQMRSKDFEIVSTIPAASWSKATITLDNTVPASIGYVRIRALSHRGIELRPQRG